MKYRVMPITYFKSGKEDYQNHFISYLKIIIIKLNNINIHHCRAIVEIPHSSNSVYVCVYVCVCVWGCLKISMQVGILLGTNIVGMK